MANVIATTIFKRECRCHFLQVSRCFAKVTDEGSSRFGSRRNAAKFEKDPKLQKNFTRFKSEHDRAARPQTKKKKTLFTPLPYESKEDKLMIGKELTGTNIDKGKLVVMLREFGGHPRLKELAKQKGLDDVLFDQALRSFSTFCLMTVNLPPDLHVVISDFSQGAGRVGDLFPFFLEHAREIFPHLTCMRDLKKISDLTEPVHWYPEARSLRRKVVYHAGPTNSGKTHSALGKLFAARTGVYCGPLKLLAVEVFNKAKEADIPCDLVTGDERRMANVDGSPACHVSSTVEMTSVVERYDVAVIDEVQMIRDPQRGWAWTRAVLGLWAKEVHVCGEASAVDFIRDLAGSTGDEFELKEYERMTSLTYLDEPLGSLDNVRAGDCIVCFNKNDVYVITMQLMKLKRECAVIYGSLPPGTKLQQAQKFNDPSHPCKILVATDAIGMGLNLSIKRIIFYTLEKPIANEDGLVSKQYLSTSQVLQIAGRAGRFGSQFQEGEVTTFREHDLPVLREMVEQEIDPVLQGGLEPTAEQIETFGNLLPNTSLSKLVHIFKDMCRLDHAQYFLCRMDDFKALADLIEDVPLLLKERYIFCLAPVNRTPFVTSIFLKYARRYSKGSLLTADWVMREIGWPIESLGKTREDLRGLEEMFDVLEIYLWLSYRFPDMLPDGDQVRDIQNELDDLIQTVVSMMPQLASLSKKQLAGGVLTPQLLRQLYMGLTVNKTFPRKRR